MRLSEGNPFKTCTNPHTRDQNVNRANIYENQRRRDDNKNKSAHLRGGGALEAKRNIVQNAVCRGKRHDNIILKVQVLLSKNVVVIGQAPRERNGLNLSRFKLFGASPFLRGDKGT